MAPSAPNFTVVRFSSCALPERGRAQAIEELHERGLLATRFAPCGKGLPRVDLTRRTVPGLAVLTARAMAACATKAIRPTPASEAATISFFA